MRGAERVNDKRIHVTGDHNNNNNSNNINNHINTKVAFLLLCLFIRETLLLDFA